MNGLQENEISLVQVRSSEYYSFKKNMLLNILIAHAFPGAFEMFDLFEIEYFFVQICMFSYFFHETQLALMGYELTKRYACIHLENKSPT